MTDLTIAIALATGAATLAGLLILLILAGNHHPNTGWSRTAVTEWRTTTIIAIFFSVFFLAVAGIDWNLIWILPTALFLTAAWIAAGCADYAARYRSIEEAQS